KRSRRFAPVLAVSRDTPQDNSAAGLACSPASCAGCDAYGLGDCPAAGEKPDDEEEPLAAGK
ncbi:MAG: hypothetical protein LBG26_03155, partial [Treponema sp.]|nr:hypothetical protein [Treponema sp.]